MFNIYFYYLSLVSHVASMWSVPFGVGVFVDWNVVISGVMPLDPGVEIFVGILFVTNVEGFVAIEVDTNVVSPELLKKYIFENDRRVLAKILSLFL